MIDEFDPPAGEVYFFHWPAMPICPTCGRRFNDAFERCSEDGTPLVLDSTPLSLPPGTVLSLGVTIQHFVGAGPTGEVFAADRQGHTVAVKLLSPELTADRNYLDRLVRLQTHLAKVQHPGVARAYGLGEHQGYRVIVRELIAGRSASDLLMHMGPLPPMTALTIALRAAEALTEAHRSGALHLNLKPSNLFILEGDQVKLVDFGVAQRVGLERGMVYGDPHFLAPEQYEGKLVSFRSDIYGLGCLLYYLLSGQAPYQNDPAVYVGPMVAPPVLPSSLVPQLAGQSKLDQLVMRAVEPAPNKRYLSVQHFGRMMDGLLLAMASAAGPLPARRPAQTLRMGQLMPEEVQAAPPTRQPVRPDIRRRGEGGEADTVRMMAPPTGNDPAGMAGQGLPDSKATIPMSFAVNAGDTIREQARNAPAGSAAYVPAAPPGIPRGREEHDTIRVAVPPPVERGPQAGQPGAQVPNYPPQPYAGGGVGNDGLEIDIVTEEPIAPMPLQRRRKKKRKKRKKRAPVIAVRGEAAFHVDGNVQQSGYYPGESVLVEDGILDEARGPQRNLETMEIRIVPESRFSEPPSPGLSKTGRILLAIGGLLLLFVLAALGAAALAHWLSAPEAEPAGGQIEAPLESDDSVGSALPTTGTAP